MYGIIYRHMTELSLLRDKDRGIGTIRATFQSRQNKPKF